MTQNKLLLGPLIRWAFFSWTLTLSMGELSAQQTMRRSSAGVSVNSGQMILPTGQSTRLGMTQHRETFSDSPFITVFGAVKTPTVFEITERSVPLQTLLERAGGETLESIGSVRIMEHAATRFKPNQSSKFNQLITRGQIVFVVPKGGRTAQVYDPRKSAPDRFVLVTGLATQPLLINTGSQPRTLRQLILQLGQSEDLLANGQVKGTQPQGTLMDLESLLSHNSGIHFDPESVNQTGFQRAVEDGLQAEPLVRLEGPRTVSPASPTPINPIPNPVRSAPVTERQPTPIRITPAAPPVSMNTIEEREGSGIEPAGSSILFDEPMPFPSGTTLDDENPPEAPHLPSHGNPPLMMPKSWQNPDSPAEDDVDNPVRSMNRTSASRFPHSNHIRTASALAEDLAPRGPTPQLDMEPDVAANPEVPRTSPLNESSAGFGPQSWFALLVTLGIAALSVFVSRHIVRERASTLTVQELATNPAPVTSAQESAAEPSPEDEQRFLQRLIMNKVPLIEEEPTLPAVDRLHGTAIGGRRLVINESHENVAGPHFKVRDPRDTRAVELRLRQLMRTGNTSSRQAVTVSATTDLRDSHVSKVSPLERALRNVERGDTP